MGDAADPADITLTKAQGIIYEVILDYFHEFGRSPTLKEIMAYSGYGLTTVVYRLPELVEFGLITREHARPRSIALTDLRLPQHEAVDPPEEPSSEDVPWLNATTEPKVF